jgi:negative regulator of flagellin synthesis FlgM
MDKTASDAKVSIPEGVREFSRIKKAAMSAPEPDNSEKIARLKAQIQAGTYEVDYDGLADKILTSEF